MNASYFLEIPPNRQLCVLLTPATDTQNVSEGQWFPPCPEPQGSHQHQSEVENDPQRPSEARDRGLPLGNATSTRSAASHLHYPFLSHKNPCMLVSLKKQQRWYKGLEANHVPSEVNKSLSKLISTEHLSLFPKCMPGIWTTVLRILLNTIRVIFWMLNAPATNQMVMQSPRPSFFL